jgi:hypothetical protein
MDVLPDSFLQALAAWLDDENTLGIAIMGSFARNEGGPYSDVDLTHYVRQKPVGEAEPCHLKFVNGFLVSFKKTTLEAEYASLRNPEQAIWTIPALRQLCILLDKDGSVAALKETAAKATWEPLQAAADAYASRELSGYAEEIHKILGGLAQRDESKTLYAVWGLTRGLSNALLTQRGVLISTENAYIDFAQNAAGRTSGWTRQFRLAIGLDPLLPGEPAFVGYGVAGLHLYRETVAIFRHILSPEDADVVNQTLEIIVGAGY